MLLDTDAFKYRFASSCSKELEEDTFVRIDGLNKKGSELFYERFS